MAPKYALCPMGMETMGQINMQGMGTYHMVLPFRLSPSSSKRTPTAFPNSVFSLLETCSGIDQAAGYRDHLSYTNTSQMSPACLNTLVFEDWWTNYEYSVRYCVLCLVKYMYLCLLPQRSKRACQNPGQKLQNWYFLMTFFTVWIICSIFSLPKNEVSKICPTLA